MNVNFKINGVIIETERLILRSFRHSDLKDFYEYASVNGVGEMAGWCHHKNIEETQSILDGFIDNDRTFALVSKGDNKVIGSLGVEKYGREEDLTEFAGYRGSEIGFVLSKTYWGKGLMPEAVKGIIGYLFDNMNYDFLLCGYYEFNHQSKRVQEKCGFKPYRRFESETKTGERYQTTLNILLNPKKKISLVFSHPETLIYEEN